jgi:phosphatidylglycerol:prolipoprotein diacylglycerol transferase
MFPDFTLFGITYPVFEIIGVAALVIGAAIAALRAKKYNFKDTDIILSAVFAGIGLILGSTILFAIVQVPQIIQHREHFDGNFLLLMGFLFGGMIFYGGLFGAIFGLWLFSKFFKRDFCNLLCIAVPVIPLTHGIMRLGCFAAGCCHGIAHDTMGIAFTRSIIAENGVPFLPVQLYEAAFNFIIFAAIWQFSKKPRKPLHLLCFYALPYAIGRFALEFLRGDLARGTVFNMSTSQFISILILIILITALIFSIMKGRFAVSPKK